MANVASLIFFVLITHLFSSTRVKSRILTVYYWHSWCNARVFISWNTKIQQAYIGLLQIVLKYLLITFTVLLNNVYHFFSSFKMLCILLRLIQRSIGHLSFPRNTPSFYKHWQVWLTDFPFPVTLSTVPAFPLN